MGNMMSGTEQKQKPWSEMTEKEIEKIKKEKCRNCIYSRAISFGDKATDNRFICGYILVIRHSRGCRPDQCDKYVRRKKRRGD